MLENHKLRQQAARRGETPARWKLYETDSGNVPKELAQMFSGIESAKQVTRKPKVPVLTTAENSVLKASLQFINRHGITRFEKVVDPEGLVPPTIERIKAAKGPLMELKVKSRAHNPRFIFVDCNDVAIFLDAFKKKAQKLTKKDIAPSEKRYVDLKTRGECS